MNSAADLLVVEMGKVFLELLDAEPCRWHKAYLRYGFDDGMVSYSGIFFDENMKQNILRLIDKSVRHRLLDMAYELRDLIKISKNVEFKACLLRVNNEFDFQMAFDYEDPNRWLLRAFSEIDIESLPD